MAPEPSTSRDVRGLNDSGLPQAVPSLRPMDLAQLTHDLEALAAETRAAISAAPDVAALDALELDVLGKKGRLTSVLRGIGALPADERPKVGAIANVTRASIEAALAAQRSLLGESELEARLAAERVDVTTPGRPIRRGSLHPSIEAMGEIARIFGQFGFVVEESPEIEDDLTNFQLLNIPPDHPARDLWDTLYVDVPGHLLRTHTSPGQIRVMRSTPPPIRVLLPGRCFRYESIDASHASEFFQVEGLMVDEGTTLGDLRGLLEEFAHGMFGPGRKTRFRPGYYPFTEPSVAFDLECLVCGGVGCAVCGRTGWLTILGAGMVHPVVLRGVGLDPERYQGFAFGMGPERISMLKHRITDLRLFMDNDLRFLEQFR
jgi:phenylalanyl-tRNA synthetase alpha chain